ncbi:Protein crumbs 3 [Madurella mycetomatis]|uniref:Protein crumbs 3 n=1 Tax=Madurella mycetomatis TaxID=100816 RepID=A0A175VTL8_9PEZI|nr:Protein crumbs 3 [Madurella mycetomatis]
MASLLSALLLLGAGTLPARAAISAWWTEIGPQVILQNETTGLIRYSACNSYNDPKYSYTDGSVLSLTHKPKVGTPLAGTGYWADRTTTASIYYIEEGGDIANAVFQCNMTSGLFQNRGNWIISNQVPSIHANTGLAAILLGAEGGYRVYYHDQDGAINELGYTVEYEWQYRGVISQDVNSLPALAAAFYGIGNITVASPRGESNIATTRWHRDETWRRSTLPQTLQGDVTDLSERNDIAINETVPANFSLPAWDGETSSLGISINSQNTRFLWYIGNDNRLYSVADQNGFWSLRANQSDAFWPLADRPNADLAVAYRMRSNNVRIYYMVDERLSEIKYEDNLWKAWSTVAPKPSTDATQPSRPAGSASDTGLSTGAKVGIGVGVSLGAIALGAIVAILVLMRRRKQTLQQLPHAEAESAVGFGTSPPSYGSPTDTWDKNVSPAPDYQVHQLDGATAPAELGIAQPMYELPSQTYAHELVAEQPHGATEQRR